MDGNFRYLQTGKKIHFREEGDLELFCVFEEAWTFRRRYTLPFNTLVAVLEDGDSDDSTMENLLTHEIRARRKGDIYFTPAQLPVLYNSTSKLHFIAVHFNLFRYPGIDVYKGRREWIFERDPGMVRKIRKAFLLPDRLQSITAVRACCMEFCVAHWPSSYQNDDSEEMTVFLPVLEFIRSGISALISVSDLADRLQMRPDVFTKRFVKLFDKTPKEYLQNELAARAANMLLQPGIHVKDVAFALGFADEYYFSKFFKRRVGCSPLVYQKRSIET